ncbi:MAG: hypothetical protein V5A43_04355 [Haloarculaceae archaeon]
MRGDRSPRRRLGVAILFGLVLVVAGTLAGTGTYALFSDSETDDAGTISVVTNNNAPVNFQGCKQAEITPDDPADFDMTVTLVDGTTASYNESDFDPGADGTFTYSTRDEWGPPPEDMASITLDGITYQSSCS